MHTIWHGLRRKDGHAACLTGFPPLLEQPVFAMRTVGVTRLRDGVCSFGPGEMLRYAAEPVSTFFMNPDFFLTTSSFARRAAERENLDFLVQAGGRESFYTLHTPVCAVVQDNEVPPVTIAGASEEEEKLCRRAGLFLDRAVP